MTTGKYNKSKLFAGAAVIALGCSPVLASAYAQDTDGDDDVITITGIKKSIQDSLAAKKESTSIIEAISAEDIGKLPDLSIADSLARLPGVTAQRVRGRAQQISIRGLGPDFSIALLNGREVVSAGNNRGIEFDQFPSELIAQGLVYKTPDAKLAATGIAGAVDLRTIRPLDYSGRQLNVSGKYVLNDQDQLNPDFDEDGYRLFGSYIDQNEDGTVGWSLGVTVQTNPTQFTSRELKTSAGQTATDPVSGLIYPSDNPRTGVVSREFERTSVAGTLQFEPTDQFRTTFDAFYTDTEDAGIFRGLETPIASWSGASFDSATGSGPFASTATYNDVVPILRTDTEGNTAEIWAFGVNTAYDVSDRLTISADLSNSTLERSDIDYESYAGTGPRRLGAQDTLTYILPGDGEYAIDSQVDYTDPSVITLTDPGGWNQVGFIRTPDIEDDLTQLRLEADYKVDNKFFSSVTSGLLYTTREKVFDDNAFFLRSNDSWSELIAGDATTRFLPIPTSSILGSTDSGSIGLDIIAYNPSSFLTDGTYTVEETGATEWTVEEDILTLYAMANIDGTWGTVPVRGNIGFQYQDVTQESTGTLAGTGEQTVEDDYTHFLPSVNLSFEVQEDQFIRVAAAQTVTRPRLDQLAANQDLNPNSLVCIDNDLDQIPDVVVNHSPPERSCYTLSGGNPFLQPYESVSFDLAYERYFNSTSALSIAFFHKELSDWVVDRATVVDASQQIIAEGGGDLLAANPEIAQTRLDGPTNFADGSITGIEATIRMSLDEWLPENLAGFGFNASYTYADNGLENDDGSEITIPGYSDEIWSGDIYYENHGWRTRLSARHRSGFLSEVQQFDGTLTGAQALEETIIDAQVGYEWESGPLEGFTVNFEAYNLTDEPFATEDFPADGVSFPSRYEEYGTTYNFTIAKRF
jgi:iron complex outermembrane receptor protein